MCGFTTGCGVLSLCFFWVYRTKSKLFFVKAPVCGSTIGCLNLIFIITMYAAVRRTSFSMYLYVPVTYSCCCCCSVCYYPAVAAAAVLLLFFSAAVGHRVPDDALCCCSLLHLIPVFSFSSFKRNSYSMYPLLAVQSHVQSRFTYNPMIHIIMHPRKLPACAEPRRAAARRGKIPHVVITIIPGITLIIIIMSDM